MDQHAQRPEGHAPDGPYDGRAREVQLVLIRDHGQDEHVHEGESPANGRPNPEPALEAAPKRESVAHEPPQAEGRLHEGKRPERGRPHQDREEPQADGAPDQPRERGRPARDSRDQHEDQTSERERVQHEHTHAERDGDAGETGVPDTGGRHDKREQHECSREHPRVRHRSVDPRGQGARVEQHERERDPDAGPPEEPREEDDVQRGEGPVHGVDRLARAQALERRRQEPGAYTTRPRPRGSTRCDARPFAARSAQGPRSADRGSAASGSRAGGADSHSRPPP